MRVCLGSLLLLTFSLAWPSASARFIGVETLRPPAIAGLACLDCGLAILERLIMVKKRVPRRKLSRLILAVAAGVLALLTSADRAIAQWEGWQLYDYGVLMESSSTLTVSGTGDKILGNIGMGGTGDALNLSGATSPTITGHSNGDLATSTSAAIGFAAASGSSAYTPPAVTTGITSGTGQIGAPTSSPQFNVSNIGTALNIVNGINTNYGSTQTVNPLFINSGGLLVLPAGNGPFVYNATINNNFSTGSNDGNFTIQGTANQQVVIDIAATGTPTLDGSIVFAGTLKDENVVINITGANNTFTMDTFGNTTYGMYIDDATGGEFAVTNSEIHGLLVGGNNSTMSNSTILSTPEPSSIVLAGMSLLALFGFRRVVSQRKGKLA
jgi:hypothetical protein